MQRVEGNVKRDFSDPANLNDDAEGSNGETGGAAQNSEGGVEFDESEIIL